jgi:ATP-dependent 26S proteasome regulatory subunit
MKKNIIQVKSAITSLKRGLSKLNLSHPRIHMEIMTFCSDVMKHPKLFDVNKYNWHVEQIKSALEENKQKIKLNKIKTKEKEIEMKKEEKVSAKKPVLVNEMKISTKKKADKPITSTKGFMALNLKKGSIIITNDGEKNYMVEVVKVISDKKLQGKYLDVITFDFDEFVKVKNNA